MKNLLLSVVVLALLAPAHAAARDFRPGFGARVQQQNGYQANKAPGQSPRGERNQRGDNSKGQKGRLTEEERRQLQQDLDRANREIYRR